MMALALLTPQLDAQTSFSKLFADIGTQKDVRHSDLHCSLPALRRLLRSLPSMSRPSALTCGLRRSRMRRVRVAPNSQGWGLQHPECHSCGPAPAC